MEEVVHHIAKILQGVDMVKSAEVSVVEGEQLEIEPCHAGATQVGHARAADVADGGSATHGYTGRHMQGLAQSPTCGPELLGRGIRCNAAPQMHAHDLAIVELADICPNFGTQGT